MRDVGDFDAHQDERDKGTTWIIASRYAAMTDRNMTLKDDRTVKMIADSVRAAVYCVSHDRLFHEADVSTPMSQIGISLEPDRDKILRRVEKNYKKHYRCSSWQSNL